MEGIFASVFVVSIAVIIALLVRKLPRARVLVAMENAGMSGVNGVRAGVAATANAAVAQAGNVFMRLLERLLRRVRIFSMRLDNVSSRLIERTRIRSRKFALTYQDWRAERKGTPKISFDAMFINGIEEWFSGFYSKYFRRGVGHERAAVRDDLAPREKTLVSLILANPKDTEAYRELGLYYFEKGNAADALAAFEAIRKIDPTNSEAAERVAHIKKSLDDNV